MARGRRVFGVAMKFSALVPTRLLWVAIVVASFTTLYLWSEPASKIGLTLAGITIGYAVNDLFNTRPWIRKAAQWRDVALSAQLIDAAFRFGEDR